MNIKKTEQADLSIVMGIYDCARNFMRANGNSDQWINGYPSAELISREIKEGHSFVCENNEGKIIGTFCFIEGEDPTYLRIYGGRWLNDEPYGVIHRMASSGEEKGIMAECLKWCFLRCKNIRVDTHRRNLVMRNVLKKNGFTQCGIIYIQDGTERLAFQKNN